MQIQMSALVRRINRRLIPESQQLRKTRGGHDSLDLGDYWIHDLSGNYPADTYVDPEELGRELGCLRPSETVIDGR